MIGVILWACTSSYNQNRPVTACDFERLFPPWSKITRVSCTTLNNPRTSSVVREGEGEVVMRGIWIGNKFAVHAEPRLGEVS